MDTKITVHARKVLDMPGTFEGYILVDMPEAKPYAVDTGIFRLTKTDAIHDAAFLSEDYQLPG